MGYGPYVAIVWGETLKKKPRGEKSDDLYDALFDIKRVRTADSQEPYFIGITVAVSLGEVADKGVAKLDEGKVFALADFEEKHAKYVESARALWQEVVALAKGHGVPLGEGRLLLVPDYDQ